MAYVRGLYMWMQVVPETFPQRAEEFLLKHEDDKLVLTIVLVENLHIH
jgi:hypothetical protein